MRVVFSSLKLSFSSLPLSLSFSPSPSTSSPFPTPVKNNSRSVILLWLCCSLPHFLFVSPSPLPPLSSPPPPPPPTHPLTPPLSKKPTLTVLREKKNGLFKWCLKTLMFSKIFAIHLAYDLHKVLVFRLIPFMNMCEQDIWSLWFYFIN